MMYGFDGMMYGADRMKYGVDGMMYGFDGSDVRWPCQKAIVIHRGTRSRFCHAWPD